MSHFKILSRTTQVFKSLLIRVCLLALICGCETSEEEKEQTVLRVITRNGLTTYYQDKNGSTGFEFELINRFAEQQGLSLEIQTVHSLDDIFEALENDTADIAAAGLTITQDRQRQWLFSPPYYDVKQLVIYNRKTQKRPKTIEAIVNKRIIVMARSSHSEILGTLSIQHPQLLWHEAPDVETVDLLDMLARDEIDFTIIDSNEFIANRGFYPQLRSAFEIGQPGKLAWALAKTAHGEKQLANLEQFFDKIKQDGTLKQLEERFYSHVQELAPVSTQTFAKAVEKKLPKYQSLIETVARQQNMDWRLLASISYQESHWNPIARSPTGVRGMMMLTRRTAQEMEIADRLDAEQSLRGGAAYYKKIKKKLPTSIKEPDRIWFTLAAYNIGLGHVKDVRKLTLQQGGNPNKWSDIKTRLPLLQKRDWYRTTRYGYARGQEALTYVQNIRHYFNYLEWSELSQNRVQPPKNMDQYLPDSLQNHFYDL